MKKVRTLLAALLLLAALALPVSALTLTPTPVPPFETAHELYASWHGTLPDYIKQVTTDEENPAVLVFHVTDMPGSPALQLRNLIRDYSTYRMVSYRPSREQLETLRQRILEVCSPYDYGLHSIEITEYNNLCLYFTPPKAPQAYDLCSVLREEYGSTIVMREAADDLPLPTPDESGRYANATELFYSWQGEWPEGVRNVLVNWENAAARTFAIAPGEEGEAAKQQILSSLTDPSTASFVEHDCTFSQLREVYDALCERFDTNLVIIEIADYCVTIGQRSGGGLAKLKAFAEEYGPLIHIDLQKHTGYTPSYFSTDPRSAAIMVPVAKSHMEAQPLKYGLFLGGGVLAIVGAAFLLSRKQRR